ncbi:MAG TPA: DHA2 family efflux MFS transporter permease subunit [Smithella sp.]|nr:DHA2 family efflux MFS transporter permease subunit [Smithella sp.]
MKETAVNKWLIVLTVMLPTFIEIMDSSVVNVTLDHIRGTMSAGIDESAWAITSYITANAIVMPMTDWLSRFFGRKRYLMFSVALFTASSVMCGLSWSLNSLIFFRVLQGVGGGALVPLSQAILFETFPEEERGKAMGVFGVGATVAPSVGLPLGGWIADNWIWRWIFYINLPIGIISVFMIFLNIKDPHYMKIERPKIDFRGISLLVMGLAALQIVLDRGQREDWFSSNFILILSIVMVVSLILLVFTELYTGNPIIDLKVFKNISFSSGTIVTFVAFFSMMSVFVLTPVFVQNLLGYTATLAGLAMMPQGLCMIVSLGVTGALSSKINPKILLVAGLIIIAYSASIMARFNMTTDFKTVVFALCILGISMGLIFVPLSILSFTGISNEKMGNATALWNLLRNIGGSIGIALIMTFLSRGAQIHQQYLVDHMTLLDKGYNQTLARLTPLFDTRGYAGGAEGTIYGQLVSQATMLSFVDVFYLLMFMMLAVIPLVIFMKTGNGQKPSIH